jgi:hypothetical protein
MYKLLKDIDGNEYAIFNENKGTIPLDEANTDYQEYLKWVAEGNTPEPADEIEE